MKPKFYPILTDCIERGVQFGLQRAFKYDDNPPQHLIEESINSEILNQLHEYFVFDSEGEGNWQVAFFLVSWYNCLSQTTEANMFRTKQHYLMMDQNIEHEISSMTYDLIESGVTGERVMDLVLNEFGDDAYDIVQFILQEESESWYDVEDSNIL